MLVINKVVHEDTDDLMDLYWNHLTKNPPLVFPDKADIQQTMQNIIDDSQYHLLVGKLDGKPVCSVTLIIIKNLTHGVRPYAIIENVVTHQAYRGKGYASLLMEKATEIAIEQHCYKIMLMTGSKLDCILNFYEKCGFNRIDKTGFIKWL